MFVHDFLKNIKQVIDITIGLRLSAQDEDEGADFIEHGMLNFGRRRSRSTDVPHAQSHGVTQGLVSGAFFQI